MTQIKNPIFYPCYPWLKDLRLNDRWLLLGSSGLEERGAIQNLLLKLLEIQVNHWRDIQRDELRNDESTNHYQSQRPPRRSIRSVSERDRNRTKHRRQRRHQNRPETIHTRIVNRLVRRLARLDSMAREVDDHDAVLLYDTHQHE